MMCFTIDGALTAKLRKHPSKFIVVRKTFNVSCKGKLKGYWYEEYTYTARLHKLPKKAVTKKDDRAAEGYYANFIGHADKPKAAEITDNHSYEIAITFTVNKKALLYAGQDDNLGTVVTISQLNITKSLLKKVVKCTQSD